MPSMPLPAGAKYLSLPQIMQTGGTARIADIRSGNYFSPLQPLDQMSPKDTKPRQFGLVPGYNLIWQPKADEMFGFWVIREFAERCDLFRLVLDTLEDRICSQKWEIKLIPESGEPQKHLDERQANDPRIKAVTALFRKPDGVLPFSKWLRAWFEDSIVIDAAAIYKERDWKGRIASFRVLDGASINRRVTEQAFTPPPPSTAYQQILYGIIWANFTTNDLTYVMRSPRSWKIYGFGQVEKCLTHVGIALRRQEFLNDYYISGNMPEAMCFLPADVPIDRVKEFQDWFDTILAGDLSNRRRLRFLPGFGKMGEKVSPNVVFPKEVLLKDPLDEWLFQMFCYNLGLPPNAMLRVVNRATAQQNVESSEEEGLEPKKLEIKEVIDDLIQSDGGLQYQDIEFIWSESREMDKLKQAQTDEIYVNTGVLSRNRVRKNLGEDPDPSPEADKLTVTTAQGIIPIDQAEQLENLQARQEITAPPDDDAKPPKGKPRAGKLLAAQVLGETRLLKAAKEARISPDHGSPRMVHARDRIDSAVRKVFRRQKDIVGDKLQKLVKAVTFRKDDEKTPKEIAQSLFDSIRKEFEAMTPEVAAALRDAMIDGVNRGLVQVEVNDSDLISEVNTVASNWARERAAELVGMKYDDAGELVENPRAQYAISNTTRDELRRIITNAFEKETKKDELISEVQDAGIFSDARATMIARTEVVRAQTLGNFEIWKKSGLVKSVRWQISDDNPCPVCEQNDDVIRKLGEPFPSGDLHPQIHPNCFTAGTLVSSLDPVAKHYRRRFNGEVVTIRVASGEQTTVTPNHPILTDNGWIAAGDLKEGENLIYCGDPGTIGLELGILPDNQLMPTLIENVPSALGKSFKMSSGSMPVASEDFHGDGITDSEVDIEWPEGSIESEVDSPLLQELCERELCPTHRQMFSLAYGGTFAKFGKCAGSSSDRPMSSGNDVSAFALGISGPGEPDGIGHASHGTALLAPPIRQGAHVHSDLPTEIETRLASHISFVKIVALGRSYFDGHVFNLETDSGYYIANGLIAKNCACILIAVEFND